MKLLELTNRVPSEGPWNTRYPDDRKEKIDSIVNRVHITMRTTAIKSGAEGVNLKTEATISAEDFHYLVGEAWQALRIRKSLEEETVVYDSPNNFFRKLKVCWEILRSRSYYAAYSRTEKLLMKDIWFPQESRYGVAMNCRFITGEQK